MNPTTHGEINVITCSGNSDTVWTALGRPSLFLSPGAAQFPSRRQRRNSVSYSRDDSTHRAISEFSARKGTRVTSRVTLPRDFCIPRLDERWRRRRSQKLFSPIAIAKMLDRWNRLSRVETWAVSPDTVQLFWHVAEIPKTGTAVNHVDTRASQALIPVRQKM